MSFHFALIRNRHMPTVPMSLPDITQSVFRPVVFDVADQVKQATDIPENIPIWYENDDGELQSAGSGLDNKTDRLMKSDSRERVQIRATERYAEDQQITDTSGRAGNVPVFVDRPLKVWMAPSYTTSTVQMEYAFYTKSKETARRWRDTVTHRYLQGRYALLHQITYSYGLPLPAYNLIRDIWEKREKIGGYGDTLEEYVRKCMTNQLQIISNEAGTQTQYTLACRQDRIQGFFSFTNEPEQIEKDKDAGLYIARFNYTFTYQRPAMFDMHYPISVHQQLLSNKFIEFVNQGPQVDDREVHRDQFLWGMKQFETEHIMRVMKPRYPYMRIPRVDDFRLDTFFPGTGMYLLVLLQQPKAEKFALNLRSLGEIVLDPDVLDFLAAGEYKHIGKPGKSIFHMDVYRGDGLLGYPAVTITENLDVMLNTDVDVRQVYHLRCALYTDLSYIDRSALDRLMAHPKAFVKVMAAINSLLRVDSSFQRMGDQKRIEPWQLTKIYEAIMGQGTCNIYSGSPMSTVAQGASGWINNRAPLLSGIPESYLRTYRTLRRSRTDVQLLGIVGYNRDKDMAIAKEQGIG